MKYLEVKIKDIEYNINKIKKYLKQNKTTKTVPKIIAVVKCNMYGFGMVKMASVLKDMGIKDFAVADAQEAIELRASGIEENIYLLSPTTIRSEVKDLIINDIIVTVQSEKDLDIIDELSRELKKTVRVNVKIDTGFGRYGVLYSNEQEILDIYKQIDSLKNIKLVSTFSHFAQSFSDKKYTALQYERFTKVIKMLKENDLQTRFCHIANTNAALSSNKYFMDAVRIGSGILGRVIIKNNLGLKRVGQLFVPISETKTLPKGYYIGYSKTYKTKKETKIAILPIGHCDGVFLEACEDNFKKSHLLSNLRKSFKKLFSKKRLYVIIEQKKYDIIGKIRTKFIIVDITGTDIKVGDEAKINTSYNYLSSSISRRYI